MRFIFLLFLLVVLLHPPAGGAPIPVFAETLEDLNLRIRTGSLQDTKNLARAAELFAREVDRSLHLSGPSPDRLQLTILRPGEQVPLQESELCFPFATESITVCHSLVRALIRRRIREIIPEAGEKLSSADWLAAALCNRIFYDGKGLKTFYSPDYRIARQQFLAGHFPQVKLLLSNPVPAGESPLFRLYLLHCDLFAGVLENLQPPPDNFFPKLFELENFGRPPDEAMEFLLRHGWPAQETLQSWYEKKVLAESGRGWQINEAENVLAQLQDLLHIPVLQTGGNHAVRRLPLQEIPDLLEDYKLNSFALSLMQNKILTLAKTAPLLLREPLQQFAGALSFLQAGKTSRFRKQFRQAGKLFEQAMQRQNKIAELLDRTTREQSPLLDSFELFLDITGKYLKLNTDLSAIPWQ